MLGQPSLAMNFLSQSSITQPIVRTLIQLIDCYSFFLPDSCTSALIALGKEAEKKVEEDTPVPPPSAVHVTRKLHTFLPLFFRSFSTMILRNS
jgi:hypothetical protein